MTQESPWFKFKVNEWLTGDIHLKSYSVKGVFSDLCAYYWSKKGDVSADNCAQKFPKNALKTLKEADIIAEDSGKIVIKFLDEQLIIRGKTSKTNSKNGSIGGIESGKSRSYKTEQEANGSTEGSNIDKNKSKRESENKIEIESEPEINFLRVGTELHLQPPSEYFKKNFHSYHEQCVRVDGAEICADAIKKLDEDYFGYDFNDHNHVRNSFKSCLDKVKKGQISNGGEKKSKMHQVFNAVQESRNQLGLNNYQE
jgi:hypothetical protein